LLSSHLRFGPQTLFAERTEWHVPWLERVLPMVTRLSEARRRCTVLTRFVPPERPEDAVGAWRLLSHWQDMSGERLDPCLIQLVPPLAALAPPAMLSTKRIIRHATNRLSYGRWGGFKAGALVITGSETDVCVLAAVMDAVDAGYRVILAEDALCSVSVRRASQGCLNHVPVQGPGERCAPGPSAPVLAR
jgi:isochorismatase family protein